MIAIICGTNRINSKSAEIAKICALEVSELSAAHEVIDLAKIESFGISQTMYLPENLSLELNNIQDTIIKPSSKWIVIVPEYNGGIPGIFKLFLDLLSIRDKDENFLNKEVLLIGVAAGRSGNLRGLDYLTNCLNYLGMRVYPTKLPISSINNVLVEGQLEENTTQTLKRLLKAFLG